MIISSDAILSSAYVFILFSGLQRKQQNFLAMFGSGDVLAEA